MQKKVTVIAVLAIITMGLAVPLGAQSSNQNGATASVFSNDVDKYMNVNKYDDVKFDKGFALIGYTSNLLGLGYATRFGDIYLGTYYNGNIVTHSTNETTRLTTTWDTALQQLLTKADEKVYTRTTTASNNNIAALIGLSSVSSMGIKVGFSENITTYNTPYNVNRGGTSTVTTNQDGSITYTNNDSLKYYEQSGSMVPSIQWGMKLDLGGYTLLPRAGANFTFYEDKFVDNYYTSGRVVYDGKTVNTGTQTYTEMINRRGTNSSYNTLNVSAGADFFLNADTSIILDYGLNTRFYDNSFDDAERSGSVKGTISWNSTNNYSQTTNYFDRTVKDDSVEIAVTEQSYTSHSINPGFRWQDTAFGDNLKFGVRVNLPITIYNQTSSNYTDQWVTTNTTYNDEVNSQNNETTVTNTHTAGDLRENSYFRIAPTVGIGASYGLVPKRFTVNAGVFVNLPAFSSTTTVTSRNGVNSSYTRTETGPDGSKYISNEQTTVYPPGQTTNVNGNGTVVDSVQTVTSWTAMSGSIRGGFTFNFNENFMLDMSVGVGTGDNSFTYNLTSLTALFAVKF